MIVLQGYRITWKQTGLHIGWPTDLKQLLKIHPDYR